MSRTLVLASASRWRRQLLERLGLPFVTASPDIDESPLPGEAILAMTRRLAEQKARTVASQFPDALVIGSDQSAVLDGRILCKPGSHAQAREQLRAQSGRALDFHTGLCVLDTASGQCQVTVESTRVSFRHLDEAQIERYLHREQPYDCAGSFRSEALGIALLAGMEGRDPTALVGLPLMALCELLAGAGLDVLTAGPSSRSC